MHIYLTPFTDADMPQFIAWLDTNHVKPWYIPTEDWIDELNKRDNEYSWVQHYIIYADEVPIGFCQYYPYWMSGEDWHGNTPVEETYSVDYLIGDANFLRKGCASAALKILNSMIISDTNAKRIIVQPDQENNASQKTLLSAGYRYDVDNKLYILER